MLSRGTQFVDVDGINTFVNVIGEGPPVFVVHGGPGFSHEYLVKPLSRLAQRRQLIFYDQPGCGQTTWPGETLSPSLTFSHFRSLTQTLTGASEIEILAHSWGALVVIGSLASDAQHSLPEISGGLFINPVAIDSANFELARLNLLSRIPEPILLEMGKAAASDGPGEEIMELILPYYYASAKARPKVPFALNKGTYLSVNAQLTDFDFSDQVNRLGNVSIVLGEQDFTTQQHIEVMIEAARRFYLLKSTGHFPFDEIPAEFERVLGQIFK